MVAVLDELGLTDLATSIAGLSPVGAAAILAETGDPRRFATARALVKHAGLAPREKLSGTFTGGPSSPARAGPGCGSRPGARSGEPADQHRLRRRYRHLTTRDTNKLKPTQAQTVIAAAILRQLHAVITTGQPGTPTSPAGGTKHEPGHPRRLNRHSQQGGHQADGRGEPHAASRTTSISTLIMGSPARRRPTRLHAAGHQPHSAMQGQTTGEAPTKPLTQTALR